MADAIEGNLREGCFFFATVEVGRQGSFSNSLIAFSILMASVGRGRRKEVVGREEERKKGGSGGPQWGQSSVSARTSQINTKSLFAPSSPLLLSLSLSFSLSRSEVGERSLGLVPFSLEASRPGLELWGESEVEPCFTVRGARGEERT